MNLFSPIYPFGERNEWNHTKPDDVTERQVHDIIHPSVVSPRAQQTDKRPQEGTGMEHDDDTPGCPDSSAVQRAMEYGYSR
jgi:hypothetical protein